VRGNWNPFADVHVGMDEQCKCGSIGKSEKQPMAYGIDCRILSVVEPFFLPGVGAVAVPPAFIITGFVHGRESDALYPFDTFVKIPVRYKRA